MSDMSDGRDRLVGVAEAAELLQVSRQTVVNWRSRRADFPAPVADLRSGPVWRQADIIRWAEAHDVDTIQLPEAAEAGRGTTVALMNMKGGVGKSTLTANFGWYCAWKLNQRVLLVDLDPQFNLSQYVMGNGKYEKHLASNGGTIVDVFEQVAPSVGARKQALKADDVISKVHSWSDGSHIDVVPSRLDLSWTLKNPTEKAQLLKYFLDPVRDQYDIVLIDCAPTESILTTAAYLASDYVLVPVRPEFLPAIGLPLLQRSIDEFRLRYHEDVEVLGIVFNASMEKPEHERARREVRKVAAKEGWDVFKNEVSYSDSYPRGSRLGRPIFLTDYARGYKVSNFVAVAEEFMEKLGA